MQKETSILTFADVDPVPNRVDPMPGPGQVPQYSSPSEISATNTHIADVACAAWKRSPGRTLPIGHAITACIAGAVNVSFAQHNKTNGSTVSLAHGNIVGKKLFSVSIYPSRSIKLWERPSWEELIEYAHANLDLLSRPGHALGTWFDDFELIHCLDVVVLVRDRDDATELGLRFEQVAIFDLEARQEIPIHRPYRESSCRLAEAGNE
jgi:hypothetical protein